MILSEHPERMSKIATPRSVAQLRGSGVAGGGGDPMSSPQMANLLNKTAAAAEEFKRLLAAEQVCACVWCASVCWWCACECGHIVASEEFIQY